MAVFSLAMSCGSAFGSRKHEEDPDVSKPKIPHMTLFHPYYCKGISDIARRD